MSMISILISSEHESSFEVSNRTSELLAITVTTNLSGPRPYSRDTLHIHGTQSDLKELGLKIAQAIDGGDRKRLAEMGMSQ